MKQKLEGGNAPGLDTRVLSKSQSPGSFSDGFKTKVFPQVTASGNICNKIRKGLETVDVFIFFIWRNGKSMKYHLRNKFINTILKKPWCLCACEKQL